MTKALDGLGVVVTRPAHQSDHLCELIVAGGGRPIAYPTLAIEAISPSHVPEIDSYNSILFISTNAVQQGLPLLQTQLESLDEPLRPDFVAVGEKTARALQEAGVDAVTLPVVGSGSEALLQLEELQAERVAGQRILIVRGVGGRELLADSLRERGAEIEYLEAYQRICPEPSRNLAEDWNRDAIQIIICTSVEGLQNILQMTGTECRRALLETPLLVPSSRIEARAEELGFSQVLVAANASDETLLEALINWASTRPHDTTFRNETMNDEKQLEETQQDDIDHDESVIEDSQIEVSDEAGAPEVSEQPEETKPASSGKGRIAWVLCLILLVALAAGGYWFNKQYSADRQANEAVLSSQTQSVAGLKQQISELAGQLESASAAGKSQADKLTATADHIKALEELVKNNSRRKANTANDWVVAEAQYLISAAAHRLKMERDVKSALLALKAADTKLQTLGEPDLITVRQQLMGDMNNLREVQEVDINGLALYLADLVNRVETLPLKKGVVAVATDKKVVEKEPVEISLENWRAIADDVWQQLKSLVVIRKQAVPDAMLFDPDMHYFLYQNLRLELASARLSVLRTDTANMQASLKLVRGWLTEYFKTDAAAVANILKELEKMQGMELAPALPDLTASRNAITNYMDQQGAQ